MKWERQLLVLMIGLSPLIACAKHGMQLNEDMRQAWAERYRLGLEIETNETMAVTGQWAPPEAPASFSGFDFAGAQIESVSGNREDGWRIVMVRDNGTFFADVFLRNCASHSEAVTCLFEDAMLRYEENASVGPGMLGVWWSSSNPYGFPTVNRSPFFPSVAPDVVLGWRPESKLVPDRLSDYGPDTWFCAGCQVVRISGSPDFDKSAVVAQLLRAGGVSVPEPVAPDEWRKEWNRQANRFLTALGVCAPSSEVSGSFWTPPRDPVPLPASVCGWADRVEADSRSMIRLEGGVSALGLEAQGLSSARDVFPFLPEDRIWRIEPCDSSRAPCSWGFLFRFSNGAYCLFCRVYPFATDAEAVMFFGDRVGAFHFLSRPKYLKPEDAFRDAKRGLLAVPAYIPDRPREVGVTSVSEAVDANRVFVLCPRTVLDFQPQNTWPMTKVELLDLCAAILRAGGVEVPDDGE